MADGHLDYLDLSLWDAWKHPHGLEEDGLLLDHFAALPRHGVRLGYAGKILSAPDVAWCLERAADFVTIGTGAIIHHDFARQALADPAFVSIRHPVSRAHLEAEYTGPAASWSTWPATGTTSCADRVLGGLLAGRDQHPVAGVRPGPSAPRPVPRWFVSGEGLGHSPSGLVDRLTRCHRGQRGQWRRLDAQHLGCP